MDDQIKPESVIGMGQNTQLQRRRLLNDGQPCIREGRANSGDGSHSQPGG